MLSMQEVRGLGQICDTTFGRSSTVNSPTVSIKPSLEGERLIIKYMTVCHLASEHGLREQIKPVEEQSISLIKDYVKDLKKQFKELAGRSLTIKEQNSHDNVEMITTSPYTPRKTAYYRRFSTFVIG